MGKEYVFAPLITPVTGLIVIVEPSTLTPPKIVVVAVGSVYCVALSMPLLFKVVVTPSARTPPIVDKVAGGSV